MTKSEKNQLLVNLVNLSKEVGIVDDLYAKLGEIINAKSESNAIADSKADSQPTVEKVKVEPKKAKTEPKKADEKPKHDYGLPVFKQDKRFVTWTNGDGSKCRHTGIKTVINARIKDAGGVWNGQVFAWEFKNQKEARNCIKNIDRVVTEEQFLKAWNDINSKRQAR